MFSKALRSQPLCYIRYCYTIKRVDLMISQSISIIVSNWDIDNIIDRVIRGGLEMKFGSQIITNLI